MFKRLTNKLLLVGQCDGKLHTTVQLHLPKNHKCEIQMFGETINQYSFYETFDSKKDTIIFWPGNVGATGFLSLLDDTTL